jgi:hypothetical protein
MLDRYTNGPVGTPNYYPQVDPLLQVQKYVFMHSLGA